MKKEHVFILIIASTTTVNIIHDINVKIITLQLRRQNEKNAQNSMNTRLNSMNILCSMKIHKIYNFSSINHNEISKKKVFLR